MEIPNAVILSAHGTSMGSADQFSRAIGHAKDLYPGAKIVLSCAVPSGTAPVASLESLFQELAREGYRRLLLVPLYVHVGKGYRDAVTHADAARPLFDEVHAGKPLLYDQKSCRDVASLLLSDYHSNEAVCFMGHGSPDSDNAAYHQLARELADAGRRAFLFVMEGEPSCETILMTMEEQRIKKIILAPLLMVKGSHVIRDMSGVYRERFEKKGISVVIDDRVLLDRDSIMRYMLTSAGAFQDA